MQLLGLLSVSLCLVRQGFGLPAARGSSVSISGHKLRIMPLGDSITQGFQSSDSNGYRQDLVTLLAGNTVDMVGDYASGTMADPDEQGIDGAVIQGMANNAGAALSFFRPNIVLLHAGTNDMNNNVDTGNAPARLSALIDQIQKACPDATVIVAQIIASSTAATQALIEKYNAAVATAVQARTSSGQHVALVNMSHALTSDQYADALHPNDKGYATMASLWYGAIADVVGRGWISDPVAAGTKGEVCAATPNWAPNGQIATGAGLGANLYAAITCADSSTAQVCSCSSAQAGFTPYTVSLTGSSCADMGYERIVAVRFADIDGDGRNDYVWVGANGELTVFRNQGPLHPTQSHNAAQVSWQPSGVVASGVGGKRHQIQLADLNGDGRADYLWVHDNGSVDAWINGGWTTNSDGSASVTWYPQGQIAGGIGMPGSSIRFADLNGDRRAEYLGVGKNGAVTAYLNGNALVDDGANGGHRNWISQGQIATGTDVRANIVFADLDGDGRSDYCAVTRSGTGAVHLWKNLEDSNNPASGPNGGKVVWFDRGSVATGDGSDGMSVELADISGDGRADYLEVDPKTSAVTAYFNGCQPAS